MTAHPWYLCIDHNTQHYTVLYCTVLYSTVWRLSYNTSQCSIITTLMWLLFCRAIRRWERRVGHLEAKQYALYTLNCLLHSVFCILHSIFYLFILFSTSLFCLFSVLFHYRIYLFMFLHFVDVMMSHLIIFYPVPLYSILSSPASVTSIVTTERQWYLDTDRYTFI